MKRQRALGENVFCAVMDEANFMKQWRPDVGEVVLVKIKMFWGPIDPINIGWTWQPAEVITHTPHRVGVQLLDERSAQHSVSYDDVKKTHPLEALGSL